VVQARQITAPRADPRIRDLGQRVQQPRRHRAGRRQVTAGKGVKPAGRLDNLMITATPCLLRYHHDPGVSD